MTKMLVRLWIAIGMLVGATVYAGDQQVRSALFNVALETRIFYDKLTEANIHTYNDYTNYGSDPIAQEKQRLLRQWGAAFEQRKNAIAQRLSSQEKAVFDAAMRELLPGGMCITGALLNNIEMLKERIAALTVLTETELYMLTPIAQTQHVCTAMSPYLPTTIDHKKGWKDTLTNTRVKRKIVVGVAASLLVSSAYGLCYLTLPKDSQSRYMQAGKTLCRYATSKAGLVAAVVGGIGAWLWVHELPAVKS